MLKKDSQLFLQFTKYLPYLLLLLAIIAVSVAAVIVVLIQRYNMPSEVIAMYRTFFAGMGALLLSFINKKHKWIGKKSTLKSLHWVFLAGLFLAIHFATWFLSLEYVSVAISTTFVDTVPIFMAIFGFLLFKEKINVIGITGIIITIIGGVLLAFSANDATNSYAFDQSSIIGIILAIIGALTVTFYFLIGKKVLRDSPLWPYFGLVNISAAFSLLVYNIIRGYPLFHYSFIAFLLVGLMALGPSLIGHATYNYSLRRIPAFIIGTIIVAEPIGATILGIFILGQIPSVTVIFFALIILLGIALTSISKILEKNWKKRLEKKEIEGKEE